MKTATFPELAAVHGGFEPLTSDIFPPYDTRRLDVGMPEIFTPSTLVEHMDAFGIAADM
ncbi:MAG: hypothetical protein KBA71_09670 [Opitutaceae bacterium]|nr:hypothetical protein [Opitutaceae bacterium]